MKVLGTGSFFILLLFAGEAVATVAKRDEITHYIIKGLGKPNKNEKKEKKEARQLAILLSKSPMGRLSPHVPWRQLMSIFDFLLLSQFFSWCCDGCPCCGLSAGARCAIFVFFLVVVVVIVVVTTTGSDLIRKERQLFTHFKFISYDKNKSRH